MSAARIKPFRSGNSEAVRLPREMAYGDTNLDLTITRSGDVVTIYPTRSTMAELAQKLLDLPGPDRIQEREPFEAPDRLED